MFFFIFFFYSADNTREQSFESVDLILDIFQI